VEGTEIPGKEEREAVLSFRFRVAKYRGRKTIMTKKTPIAQRRLFLIEYPRFWESKKTQRATTIGTKKKKYIKTPPYKKGSQDSRISEFKSDRSPSWIRDRYFFRWS
jgi:hypothetical protein